MLSSQIVSNDIALCGEREDVEFVDCVITTWRCVDREYVEISDCVSRVWICMEKDNVEHLDCVSRVGAVWRERMLSS